MSEMTLTEKRLRFDEQRGARLMAQDTREAVDRCVGSDTTWCPKMFCPECGGDLEDGVSASGENWTHKCKDCGLYFETKVLRSTVENAELKPPE